MKLNSVVGMCFILSFLVGTVGCADESLQEIFQRKMKDDKMDGYNIIHIEENDQYGLIVNTSWTKQYIENKNEPGIHVYKRDGSKWVMRPGTGCSAGGTSKLGIPGKKTLYCGALTIKRPFAKIIVGDHEAKIFPVTDDLRVWYAVGQGRDLKVKGIAKNGSEHKFR